VATDKESWLDKLASAFDVPVEFLGLTPPKSEEYESIVASGDLITSGAFTHLWEQPVPKLPEKKTISFELSGMLTPGQWKEIMGLPSPITQIATDLAVNGEVVVALHENGTVSSLPLADYQITPDGTVKKLKLAEEDPVHIHFEPDPDAPYLEGDGDIDSGPKPSYLSFDVLGKASPVVIHHKPELPQVWETALGKVVVTAGGMAQVWLTGTVSTSVGQFQLGADLVTPDIELAKKLIGVLPNDGPGTGACFLEVEAGSQPYTWEAGTGWIPLPVYKPLHAALPEFSVKKGGVKFDHELWAEGTWEPAEEKLFDPSEAPYGWFCTVCCEHMIVHTGDPVACDSGGYLRPATSAEHKLAMLQQ
jgi:hypothetical protein